MSLPQGVIETAIWLHFQFIDNADKGQIITDATAYLNSLLPGQTLYKSQLQNIALINGADDATVTLPAVNVVPTSTQMIRPGVILAP